MRKFFADTFYWVALINPRDAWHDRVMSASQSFDPCRIFTTDEVLIEFLAQFASWGPGLRRGAARLVREILDNPNIDVIPQSRDSFLAGLALYDSRPDKHYSLTDCISMHAMRENDLVDVLTHDEHFRQEGFQPFFRS